MTEQGSGSRAALAAGRRLADQRRAAEVEVERLLDAALRVVERSAPESPKVADIVAEAGSSNHTFYRYFASKDDLLLAVLERGIDRVRTYAEHQMSKADDPEGAIARWIEAVLAQAVDQRTAATSRAVVDQLSHLGNDRATEGDATLGPLRDLLLAPLHAAGSRDPRLDAGVIYEATFGTMHHHLREPTAPSDEVRAHLVAFCLAGIARSVAVEG